MRGGEAILRDRYSIDKHTRIGSSQKLYTHFKNLKTSYLLKQILILFWHILRIRLITKASFIRFEVTVPCLLQTNPRSQNIIHQYYSVPYFILP